MRRYPQYNLQHIFRKSFKDGGLTKNQIVKLYEDASKEIYDRMRFDAYLAGYDLDGTSKGGNVKKGTLNPEMQKKGFVPFGRPEDYANMTQEQKEQLTQQMMGPLKTWAGQAEKSMAPKARK